VVLDRSGFALYFTRAAVPHPRNSHASLDGNKAAGQPLWGYRHLGLYVYRREFLLKFTRLRPTPLEQIESLEQLRALAYGYRIYVAQVNDHSVEVDTADDLKRAADYLHALAH
jgi:3-deoxy-manno-octulosonate cytidylyltransferase (CMP-KDO synthetase)